MSTRRQLLQVVSSFIVAHRLQDGTNVATATLTGDLITDAVRALCLEGDGLTHDSSIGIYPERHELLPNTGFERDVRRWGAIFGALDRTSDWTQFGDYAGEITVTADGETLIVSTNAVPGESPLPQVPYVYRVWLYAQGNAIGQTVTIYLFEGGGSQSAAITAQRNYVLTAGVNELIARGTIIEPDRTSLACYFQITGLATGDVVLIDGASCFKGAVAMPTVGANEVFVPFVADPNLAPDFESGVSGWTPTNVTATQDTLHVYPDGKTKSMKLVATADGTASVYRDNVFTGSPIPQDAHAASVQIWPGDGADGKLCRVFLLGFGGAESFETISSVAQRLVAGEFMEVLANGTPAQSDRTSIRVQIQLESAEIGDTIWISGLQATDDYVAATPATVTRSGGRIQLPMAGLSTRQGWLAMGVRPAWSTLQTPQPGRPTMPVTLWQWQDDANNGLRLTFDGGSLTLTRSANGVSRAASSPWCPTRGVEATLVCTWSDYGPFVSVDGRALVGTTEVIASDDFARSDVSTFNGQTTPVGGKTWSTGGQGIPRILSGRYEPHASMSGNGYAYLDLGEIPFQVGGTVSYTGASGGPNHTIAWAPALGSTSDLLHLFLNRTSANYQYDTAFTNYIGATLATVIPNDGTPVDVLITLQGDTLAARIGDESYAWRHESAARLATSIVFWEVARTSGGMISRWESIVANRVSAWTATTTAIPSLSATHADVGSNGGDDGHFCGDILWVMAGRGELRDADLAAATQPRDGAADPLPVFISRKAAPLFRWDARGNSLFTYAYQPLGGDVRR